MARTLTQKGPWKKPGNETSVKINHDIVVVHSKEKYGVIMSPRNGRNCSSTATPSSSMTSHDIQRWLTASDWHIFSKIRPSKETIRLIQAATFRQAPSKNRVRLKATFSCERAVRKWKKNAFWSSIYWQIRNRNRTNPKSEKSKHSSQVFVIHRRQNLCHRTRESQFLRVFCVFSAVFLLQIGERWVQDDGNQKHGTKYTIEGVLPNNYAFTKLHEELKVQNSDHIAVFFTRQSLSWV